MISCYSSLSRLIQFSKTWRREFELHNSWWNLGLNLGIFSLSSGANQLITHKLPHFNSWIQTTCSLVEPFLTLTNLKTKACFINWRKIIKYEPLMWSVPGREQCVGFHWTLLSMDANKLHLSYPPSLMTTVLGDCWPSLDTWASSNGKDWNMLRLFTHMTCTVVCLLGVLLINFLNW